MEHELAIAALGFSGMSLCELPLAGAAVAGAEALGLGIAGPRGSGEYGVDDGGEGVGEGGAPALAGITSGFDEWPEYRRVCTFVREFPNVAAKLRRRRL